MNRAPRRASVRGAAACALLLALSSVELASADGRPRVVILSPGASELGARMEAELSTIGFDAETVPAPRGDGALAELAEATQRWNARLALSVVSSAQTSEVLLFDAATGETTAYHIDMEPKVGHAALAIHVAELVRAMLLPEPAHDDAEPVPIPPLAAPRPLAREAAPTQERPAERREARPTPEDGPGRAMARDRQLESPRGSLASLELGPAVLGSPGGLPPNVALAMAAGAFARRSLRIGAIALIPLNAMTHAASEGRSKTRVTIVGADVRHEFFERAAVRACVAVGLAAAFMASTGEGVAPSFRDQRSVRASAGAHLRAGIAYQFTRALVFRAELLAGAQLRPFALEYAGREVARWGAPWLSGLLTVEARLGKKGGP